MAMQDDGKQQFEDIRTRSNLTRSQFLIWMGQKLNPDVPLYNMILTFTIQDVIVPAVFQQAFQTVIDQSDALRTVIEETDGVPYVKTRSGISCETELLDVSQNADPQAALQAWLDQRCALTFDLEKRLFDSVLIKLADDAFVWYLNQHHLITDGWSVALVYHRMADCYRLALENRLPDAPWPTFEAYATAERHMKETPAGRKAAEYWQGQTGEPADAMQLYGRTSRTKTTRSSRLFCDLGEARSQKLKALTQEKGLRALSPDLALFNIFMSLLFGYLHRISDNPHVAVGALAHNRTNQTCKDTIGVFIELFPLQVDLAPDETFESLHQKVAREGLQFMRYAQPGTASAEANRSCQAVLNFITASFTDFNGLPMQSRWEHSGHMDSHHILRLHVHDFDATGRFMLLFDFNDEVFSGAQQQRAIQHFLRIVDAFLEDRSQPLKRINLLTEEERKQVLVAFNQTDAPYPPDEMLTDRFEQQAHQTPDAIALVFEQAQWTYQTLDTRVNQLAHYLQQEGVGPDAPVGVFMERSLEMVVALYGILKAGGVYVPLDPDYPAARVSFMLEDTKATVILTQSHLADRLPDTRSLVCRLDTDWPLIAEQKTDRPERMTTADSLAYIIYTSGSTGQPKGVMNNHRGLCNRLRWGQETYRLMTDDRVMQKTPFSFDVSLWEFFWPLQIGGALIIARPGGHRDSAYLSSLIVDQTVTVIHFVPSMLQAFLEDPAITRCHSLKHVFCSGEALSYPLQQQFFERMDADLHNLYGPTEASIEVAHWTCQTSIDDTTVPIGYPTANTRLYILDATQQPVPLGMPGELHIGGTQVACGYLNQPGLTAEMFIPDPFSRDPGDRLYKTGDLARHRPDGAIEYLGRLDHQVKIRGFRIEPGEIEAVLAQHPAVRQAAVIAHEYASDDRRLAAYLVLDARPHNGAPSDHGTLLDDIRQTAASRLPDYMVPAAFVPIHEMPLNASGKLDRKALPLPEQWQTSKSSYVAPRTEEERILAAIWADVLRLEYTGIHNDFFELGGDSIRMIQIIARANQAGLYLTPQLFFKHPTIAELTAVAETRPTASTEQGPVTGTVELTPIQHWFFEHDRPSYHHWNQTITLTLAERINIQYLEDAVRHIASHHDALRLRFIQEDSGWKACQRADHEITIADTVASIDLSDLPGSEQETAIEAAASEMQAGLNISDGPLLRITHYELGPDKPGRLLITIHHLAVDGVSWPILLEDIDTAYGARLRGETITLPAKTTSYKRWSEQLTQAARSGIFYRDFDYWRQIDAIPIRSLPVDSASGSNTEAAARICSVSLPATDTEALLREAPAAFHTQIDDLLLTALLQTIAVWSGSQALRLDMEKHGREAIDEQTDLSRTVGWFTALFPITLQLPDTIDPGAALVSIKEQLRRIPRGGMSYGALRYLSKEQERVETLKAAPRAEVLFNYLGQTDLPFSGTSLFQSTGPLRLSHDAKGDRRYVLEINAYIKDGQLQVDWTYNEALHKQATIEHLADQYIENLQTIVAHCLSSGKGGHTPSDFPLAGLDERKLKQLAGALNRLDNSRKASS